MKKLGLRDLQQGFRAPDSRLTIIGFDHKDKHSNKYFQCRCDCGEITLAQGSYIISGRKKSCGCLQKTKRGLSRTPEGVALKGAIYRCYNPKYEYYETYGARGISVCQRYRGADGVKNLIQDIGTKPGPEFSIDRIDNDGNYCPGNLQWSTQKQQNNNRTSNRMITYKNESLNLTQWAEKLGINYQALCKRLDAGWSVKKAFTTPVKKHSRRK